MERWWKILLVVLFAVVIILLIFNLRKSDNRIEDALSKLDSTKFLLDSARAQIDSSKSMITNLQVSLKDYSSYLTGKLRTPKHDTSKPKTTSLNTGEHRGQS